MKRYNPKDIEPKWQKIWADIRIHEASDDSSKPKTYATPMFPYPSGSAMHTGHVRNFAIADVVARHYRQRGHNVMTTMAWDAFGLPAENFAIKTGTPPAETTVKNTKYFKEQMVALGISYDWSREFTTSDPEYYRWTQWLFGLMYKRGLAYQAEKAQWWCDKCKTVLADEQVIAGKCWRHDADDDPLVTKKNLKQWFFKITDYADQMLEATDDLDWPEKIKTMQKNWIGRSKGAEVDFAIEGTDDKITVFTTRPDTLYGATFLVLAPEHALVQKITTKSQKSAVDNYVQVAIKKSEIERQSGKEKSGVFTGAYAVNPANNEKIPIWIADYVLVGYGTGAIMAVPAHDERDFEFATEFKLPITQVVRPCEDDPTNPPAPGLDIIARDTVVVHLRDKSTGKFALLDWHGTLEGITTAIMGGIETGQTPEQAALAEVSEEAGLTNVEIIKASPWVTAARYFASHKNQNRKSLTHSFIAEVDNLENQQEVDDYEKKTHTLVWVDESEIMSRLVPKEQKLIWDQLQNTTALSGEGEMINSGEYSDLSSSEARERIVADLEKKGLAKEVTNYKMRDWLISRQRYWGAPIPIIHCPDHGAVLVPEEQLPVELPEVKNFAPDGSNSSVLAGVESWVNTTCPTCGKPAKRETDTMDGYVCSTWYLHRYTDADNDKMAFDPKKANYWFPLDFYFGADHAVAHLLYVRFFQRVLVDAGLAVEPEPVKQLVYNGYINAEDGSKMSKSKGNTVDPMDIINSGYGADALRVFELFIAPYEQDTNWNTNGVPGTYRFLQRVWTLTQEFLESKDADSKGGDDILRTAHIVIKKVSEDLKNMSFNTAVAAMMTAVNELYVIKARDGYGARDEWRFALESLAQLLAPFAPHFAEEIWHDLGHEDSVNVDHWPTWEDKYLVSDTITVVVQVNGKLRAQLQLPADVDKDTAIEAAKSDDKVKAHLGSGEPKKIIYVPGKLVNFVV